MCGLWSLPVPLVEFQARFYPSSAGKVYFLAGGNVNVHYVIQ